MDLGLKGRVAIVTGASQGIGKAIALSLSKEGSGVIICARNESLLAKTAREIQGLTSNEVLPVRADVTKHGEIEAVIDAAYRHFNRIDILVNNTGGPPSTAFEETSDQNWQETFDSLFRSVVRACRAIIPYMQKARWGRIVNMTSFVAKQPADRLILSNAIRAGVLGLSKSLSNELARYGILVNAVCPGWTLTARVEELARNRARAESKTSSEIMRSWESQIPLMRLAQPQEIADLVVFLASERASYITGAVVQVDGGVVRSLL